MITKDLTENMGLVMPPKTSEYSENIMVTRIPFIGRVHFVKDTNGILSLGFVVLYWIYGTWCSLYVILLPHVRDGQASELFVFVFCVCSIMCLSSLFRVSTLNPGRIPLISDESSFGLDVTKWEVCPKCCRKRPPRAHHCRRCQQCVLRMDHHCPWINNCVGEENHWAFMQLLFWAFWLGFFAFVACQLHFWYYPACITCDKESLFIKHSIWFNYLLTLLAAFMLFFLGGNLLEQHYNVAREAFVVRYSSWLTYLLTVLGFFMMLCMTGSLIGQHFSLLVDRTTLENMRDPRPDISKLNIRTELTAYKEVCGEGRVIFWLFPCRRRRARPFYLLTVNTV